MRGSWEQDTGGGAGIHEEAFGTIDKAHRLWDKPTWPYSLPQALSHLMCAPWIHGAGAGLLRIRKFTGRAGGALMNWPRLGFSARILPFCRHASRFFWLRPTDVDLVP